MAIHVTILYCMGCDKFSQDRRLEPVWKEARKYKQRESAQIEMTERFGG
jgi:hypothetical protein